MISAMNCVARFTCEENKNSFCIALDKIGCSYKVLFDDSVPFPEWKVMFDSLEFSECIVHDTVE